jgi:hypothetical protein
MLRPFFEDRSHVFGQKADAGALANPVCLGGPIGRDNQRDAGHAGGRGGNDPAANAGNVRVDGDLETELVNEKPPASLLISNP